MSHHHLKEKAMDSTSLQALLAYSRSEVDKLLASYKEYKGLAEAIETGNIESAPKFSLMGNLGKMQNLNPQAEAKKKLDAIGDSMKFQNPLIWLQYKYEAYQYEPGKELRTIADLVSHCDVDGICHKRFDAINMHLRHTNGKDLTDHELQSVRLEDLAEDLRYLVMCLDLSFQKKWSRHENDPAGKWRNYVLGNQEDEDLTCC